MLPLRFARSWLSGGLFLVAAVLFLALAPSSVPTPTFLPDKVQHMAAFISLMVWFCGVLRFRLSPGVAAALLLYGILIEGFQSLTTYRTPDVADVMADLAGILIGWALAGAGLRDWCRWVEARLPGNPAS